MKRYTHLCKALTLVALTLPVSIVRAQPAASNSFAYTQAVQALLKKANALDAPLNPANFDIGILQEALKTARSLNDDFGESIILGSLGAAYKTPRPPQKVADHAHLSQSLEYYKLQLAVNEKLNDTHSKGITLQNIGAIYAALNPEKAYAYYEEALALFKADGNHATEAITLYNLGELNYNQRRLGPAQAMYERARDVAGTFKIAAVETSAGARIAFIKALSAEKQGKIEFLQNELSKAQISGDKRLEVVVMIAIGDAQTEQNKAKEALATYTQAGIEAMAGGDWIEQANALHKVGKLELDDYNVSSPAVQKISSAETAFQQELTAARKGESKEWEMAALVDTGNLLAVKPSRNGSPDYLQAVTAFEAAIKIARELSNHEAEGIILTNMGNICVNAGWDPKAVEYFNQALQLKAGDLTAAEDPSTLCSLGYAYANENKLDEALKYFQRALEASKMAANIAETVNALAGLGYVNARIGLPKEALKYYEEALPLARNNAMPSAEAHILKSIGTCFYALSAWDDALKFENLALTVSQQVHDRVAEGGIRSDIGDAYAALGQLQSALTSYEQALAIQKETHDREGQSITLRAIGGVYTRTDQKQKAAAAYDNAMKLATEMSSPGIKIQALFGLGNIAADTNQDALALKYYQDAQALLEATGDPIGKAKVLNNIANIYLHQGSVDKAMATLNQALSIAEVQNNITGKAALLANIGSAYDQSGQTKEALANYVQAASLWEGLRNWKQYAYTLKLIADTKERSGDLSGAEEASAKAIDGLEKFRMGLGGLSSAKQSLLQHQQNGGGLSVYHAAIDLFVKHNKIAEAFAITQKTKARILLDIMAGGSVRPDAGLTAEERNDEVALSKNADILNTQIIAEGVRNEVGGKLRTTNLKMALEAAEQELTDYEEKLNRRHPRLADQRSATTVSLEEIGTPEYIPQDTALLEYVNLRVTNGIKQTVDRLVLFVITTEGGQVQKRQVSIDVPEAKLSVQCRDYLAACSKPTGKYEQSGKALFSLLLPPEVFNTIRGKKRLIVCPDGPLWDVPFQALITDSNNFLIDQFEISYAYSATSVKAAHAETMRADRSKSTQTMLVLGNPDFGGPERFEMSRKLAYSDSAAEAGRPSTEAARPLTEAARPLTEASRPLTEASRPLTEAARMLVESSRPLTEASRPLTEASRPLTEASRPLTEASRPLTEASRWLTEASRPLTEASRPLTEASRSIVLDERGGIMPLKGTQREADSIHATFPDATILTGRDAQETTFKKDAGQFRFIHVATHGWVNNSSPLMSSIILAQPPPGSTDDGFLTAREIFGLNLSAEMIVLSACNTARGGYQPGEGVIGLTWALFVAGVPSQVVTQWSVNDASTARYMEFFYNNLRDHRPKAQALQNAALALKKSSGVAGSYKHPYYWAPFVLMGNNL